MAASTREGPNPLRPYYVPVPPSTSHASESPAASAPPPPPRPSPRPSPRHGSLPSPSLLGSSARELLNDLDYSNYISDDTVSVGEQLKGLLDAALWKYTSVLLAQPFDVAKTILQVEVGRVEDDAQVVEKTVVDNSKRQSRYPNPDGPLEVTPSASDSSDSEVSYFTTTTPAAPSSRSRHAHRSRQRLRQFAANPPSPSPDTAKTPKPKQFTLTIRDPSSVLSTLSELWRVEGASGLWKAANSTFIYTLLLRALETFTRGLLSTLLDIPIPLPTTVSSLPVSSSTILLTSPTPIPTLLLTLTASTITHLVLSPIDLLRTRLLLTPSSSSPRSLLPLLRSLPSLAPDPKLLPITVLHAAIPTLLVQTTPLLLRSYLHIDPVLTPSAYAFTSLLTSCLDLIVRLPLETILRRAQVHVLQTQASSARTKSLVSGHSPTPATTGVPEFKPLVEMGDYRGVFGTIWHIVYEEGMHDSRSSTQKAKEEQLIKHGQALPRTTWKRKGQGWQGLYRGWRVGMWGIVGVWGAAAFGSGSGGDEF